MDIAMFGGTGVVGTAVVRLAVERGNQVRMLVRDPGRAPLPGLDLVVGDAMDPEAVAKTLVGCEVVVSALGGFGDGPSIDAGNASIMAAMRAAGLRRLVVMQGFHVPFPGDPRNAGARFIDAALRLRSPRLARGSHRLGADLRGCADLDWTLIRAPLVKPGGPTGRREQGVLRLGPGSHVTTGDVAEAILDALDAPHTVRTAPMVRSA